MPQDYIRFKGKVSFVEKNGKTIAKASYLDAKTRKRKQVWRTVSGKKADAKDAVINEIEKRLNGVEDKTAKTFNDLADYFEKHRAIPAVFIENVKVVGMKSYKVVRSDIKVLRGYFGEMLLTDITRDSIIAFRLAELKKPVRHIIDGKAVYAQRKLASVNHILRTMRSCLNVAIEIGWIDKIISFKGLISQAAEDKRERIPTTEEFAAILREAKNSGQPLLLPLILFIADCGARPTELFSALWTDVDLHNETITLTSDKGKKRTRQAIGLTPRLIEVIQTMPRENEFLFSGLKSVKKSWNNVKKRAGCEDLDLYSLRHLYATLLESIIDLSDFQRMLLMRHSQQNTRKNYVKLTPDVIRRAAQQLAKASYDVQNISDEVQ